MALEERYLLRLLGRWRSRATLPLHCPHCGYDVRGLPHERCPECGRSFSYAVVQRDSDDALAAAAGLYSLNTYFGLGLGFSLFGWALFAVSAWPMGLAGPCAYVLSGPAGLVGFLYGAKFRRVRRLPQWARERIRPKPKAYLSVASMVLGWSLWTAWLIALFW